MDCTSEQKIKNIEQLNDFLDYELKAARRYGRYVTLVCLEGNEYRGRESDAIFYDPSTDISKQSMTILMGETDKTGAITAVERYQSQFTEDQKIPSAAIATFPFDGFDQSELLSRLNSRFERAIELSKGIRGPVVTNG